MPLVPVLELVGGTDWVITHGQLVAAAILAGCPLVWQAAPHR